MAGGSPNITLGINETTLHKRLRIGDTDNTGVSSSASYGELYKNADDDNLYWRPFNGRVVSLISGVEFPITAPKGTSVLPSYAFADNAGTGMFLDGTGRLNLCKDGISCGIFDNNRIFSASMGSAGFPTYSFDGHTDSGLALVDIGDKRISTVVNAKNSLDVYDDKVECVNPIVSSNTGSVLLPSIAVKNINSGNAGLFKVSDTELGVSTGATEAIRIDETKMTISRNMLMRSNTEPPVPPADSGYLFRKTSPDENLYWKTSTSSVSVTNNIDLNSGDVIRAGDVVGFDTLTSSVVVKSRGGDAQSISIGCSASRGTLTYARFAAKNGESLLVTLFQTYNGNDTTNINIQGTWIKDANTSSMGSVNLSGAIVVPGELPECHCSIVEIDPINRWYIVSVVVDDSNVIFLRKVQLSVDHTIRSDNSNGWISKTLLDNIIAYDSAYDSTTDTLICVAYVPNNMNFTTVLVLANAGNNLPLGVAGGTVDVGVSTDMIMNSNKQLHVVSLPGQVVIVSYGNYKTSFITMSYNAPITKGDTIIDYDSFDCVDMHFDVNENMLICLEKTITPSCFLQAIDVLGTKMQRVASKNFKNQTMDPFGIAYNDVSGNYTMLYGNPLSMCFNIFTFDGDEFTVGMQYRTSSVYSEPYNFRKGKALCSLANRYLLGICANGNDYGVEVVRFEDGYGSYPSAFVGMAVNNATVGSVVYVVPRGSVYNTGVPMGSSWLGKKLYLSNYEGSFPDNLSIVSANNSFIGTCLGTNRILLGM